MSLSELTPVPDDTGPLDVLPGIGVGPVVDPISSITVSHVARYRMRTDRAGLNLRPGALVPASDVEYLEPAGPSFGPFVWGTPGVRG